MRIQTIFMLATPLIMNATLLLYPCKLVCVNNVTVIHHTCKLFIEVHLVDWLCNRAAGKEMSSPKQCHIYS